MAEKNNHEWFDAEGKKVEVDLIKPPRTGPGRKATGRMKVDPTTLDEAAALLGLNTDPVKQFRIDQALQMWGEMKPKSTILQALKTGWPDKGVKPLSAVQAYVYLHRMYQEMQGEVTKSSTQKTAEARQRLVALSRILVKAGKADKVAEVLDRIALIDRTPNPLTAPRTLGLAPAGEGAPPLQAMQVPELAELKRDQLLALVQTGRLPAPRA